MALNETPEYRHVRAARVSPFFSYDRFRTVDIPTVG
jgi:hypothetical protein